MRVDAEILLTTKEGMEMETEEGETAEGELTPNDIFGLDPLDVLTLEDR